MSRTATPSLHTQELTSAEVTGVGRSVLSLSTWRQVANEFFFAREVPYGLAIMRILLPLALMGNFARRWPWVREVYSLDGAPAPLADNFGYMNMLPEIPGTMAVGAFVLMVAAFLCVSAGFFTRLSLVVSTALYFYFCMMDCVGTITKYTVICTHLFLLLALSECGSIWSVDAWLKQRRSLRDPFAGPPEDLRAPIWPARLIQIFIGVVYIGAAITKMHTPVFFTGDQLMYWMMTHLMSFAPLGDLFSQYPLLLSVFAYITIIWEVVFVFCVWFPLARFPLLFIGAVFHFMTALTLGLLVFPMVMITSYFSFLREADVRWFFAGLRWCARHFDVCLRWQSKLAHRPAYWLTGRSTPAPLGMRAAAYACGLALIVAAGIEVEYRRDVYGLRRPEGRYTLPVLDPVLVQKMLGPEIPLKEKDKLLAIDAGTMVVGEHLFDRRRVFKQGDRVIVQASLNPPREDLWLDCNLVDEHGNTIYRLGQIAPRELMRSHFFFQLGNGLNPGTYAFVLKSSGIEVSRLAFTLLGQNPGEDNAAGPAGVALGN